MNINDVYGNSEWLKAADLKGKKVRVRIESWTTHTFKQQDGSERPQVSLSFAGTTKKLGLNKINAKMIASMYGDDVENWVGQEVTLYPSKTPNLQGNIVDCVRIEFVQPETVGFISGLRDAARTAPVPKLKKVDERNPPDDMNDEVPF